MTLAARKEMHLLKWKINNEWRNVQTTKCRLFREIKSWNGKKSNIIVEWKMKKQKNGFKYTEITNQSNDKHE